MPLKVNKDESQEKQQVQYKMYETNNLVIPYAGRWQIAVRLVTSNLDEIVIYRDIVVYDVYNIYVATLIPKLCIDEDSVQFFEDYIRFDVIVGTGEHTSRETLDISIISDDMPEWSTMLSTPSIAEKTESIDFSASSKLRFFIDL